MPLVSVSGTDSAVAAAAPQKPLSASASRFSTAASYFCAFCWRARQFASSSISSALYPASVSTFVALRRISSMTPAPTMSVFLPLFVLFASVSTAAASSSESLPSASAPRSSYWICCARLYLRAASS